MSRVSIDEYLGHRSPSWLSAIGWAAFLAAFIGVGLLTVVVTEWWCGT